MLPGIETTTGVLLSAVLPLPRAPPLPSPQASTWPVDVKAYEESIWLPLTTCVTVSPAGTTADTGVTTLVVVPLPSCPKLLSPQARTWPVEVRARAKS